ncbi:MAG: ADP-ribosylglycohydrolase family protein [Alistipes sp.]|nr:ADP-ribosylglycohydrolase family protein [Alistipes sp.]
MKTNCNLKSIASAVALAAATLFPTINSSAANTTTSIPKTITLTREALMDKIKGGWAGQAIGVTYGGPTEFRYLGRTMADSDNIAWGDIDYISRTMTNSAGLYDDIYMDLTFVEIFERHGIDAPVELLADAFAHADYPLWHANQAARYNILRGIKPPKSGHWRNNPHADDIDYQIEADYAGLMSPAMPNTASKISDKVGHIMNYGDGWYGGVYMGAMYSLAFITEDVEFIVTEALKSIPAKSKFYRCISDVIATYKAYPDDWRKAWNICHERWDSDVACSEGALSAFNIDASINSAYVVIGLLYGKGDFGRTIDIATRCGQDSDCNPASAGGILATAIGYSRIPDYWLAPLKQAENIKFLYTSSSLNDTYRMSFSHALQLIERNGGKIEGDNITIKCQRPKAVRFEQSFPNLEPSEKIGIGKALTSEYSFNADCAGIEIRGNASSKQADYTAEVEVTIDGKVVEVSKMPANGKVRKLEIFWDLGLKQGPHTISLRWLNPTDGASVWMHEALLLKKSK